MSATLEKFDTTKNIYSNLYSEYYRKIGLVPMRGLYSGSGNNHSFSVYYDTDMFVGNNITSSGSGSRSNIGYDQITDGEYPLYNEYINLGYAEFDQTTQKYTNFTNSVVVGNANEYYGVPLVYVSQTDGWKPVESMPYLWRNMEPFFFENMGVGEIILTIKDNDLSTSILKKIAQGEFLPPSSGVRWCFYDVNEHDFVDAAGNVGIQFYYPYLYMLDGRSAAETFVRYDGEVLRTITIKPKHKVYIIRVDNDLESSLINQLRPYNSSDYDSLFETMTFTSNSTGELKIGGNLASVFFPYTTHVGSYEILPNYTDSSFPGYLRNSILGENDPLHWNFGIVKETSATYSWIGAGFNDGEVEDILDPNRHSDKFEVSDGTASQIRLNYRNYENLFSGLFKVLVDAIELEFPVLYDVVSENIYTQSQTHYSVILRNMFKGCIRLERAPTEIPYIQCNAIGTGQYESMFEDCSLLTVSPLIYMCDDTGNSFRNMFNGCPLSKLIFKTSMSENFNGNEIGNLFGSNGLSDANQRLEIYKLSNVTYNNSTTNFNGFCGHTGIINVEDISSYREVFSDTYQHYKY